MRIPVELDLLTLPGRAAMQALIDAFAAEAAPEPRSNPGPAGPLSPSGRLDGGAVLSASPSFSDSRESSGSEVRGDADARPASGVSSLNLPGGATPPGLSSAMVGAPAACPHPTPRSSVEGASSTAEAGPEPEAPIPGASPDTDPALTEIPSEPEASTSQGEDAPGITGEGPAPAGAEVLGESGAEPLLSSADAAPEEAEGACSPEAAAGESPARTSSSAPAEQAEWPPAAPLNPRPWTDDDKRAAWVWSEAGVPEARIAAALGRKRQQINNWLWHVRHGKAAVPEMPGGGTALVVASGPGALVTSRPPALDPMIAEQRRADLAERQVAGFVRRELYQAGAA